MDPRIVPDMGVRVAFLEPRGATPSPRPAAGVVVPADAVRADGTVFVVTDGKASRRDVTLGKTSGGQREITAGVSAGERVVLSPPPGLSDGAAVRLAEPH
jgi:hypothetical protein